jgi:hypothetical protein
MPLLTVTQYANQHKVSKQSIYDRIKRGTLQTTIINGVKMIDTDNVQEQSMPLNDNQASIINDLNNNQSMLVKELKQGFKQSLKQYKQVIKRQDKQIELLQAELGKLQSKYYEAMTLMFNYNEQKVIPGKVEDVEIIPTKKKKKKK